MITNFKIIALTSKGEIGLQKNINEFGKLPAHAKLMWNTLFKREVTQKPLTLNVTIKNNSLGNLLDAKDVIKKINDSMINEGLKKNIDYEVKIK